MTSNVGQLPDEDAWFGNSPARAAGRAWLRYADLSLAAGDRVQARRGYRFVVDLWQNGDAPVQPIVTRARATLAQLGN